MFDTQGMMQALLQSQTAGAAPFMVNPDDNALVKILKPLAAAAAGSRININRPGKFNLTFGDSSLPNKIALAQIMRQKKQGQAPPIPRTPTAGIDLTSIGVPQ